MDREKQIEEIDELTTVLYEANHKKSVLDYRWLATEAYNAGYRKQSEVSKEIFDEIERILSLNYCCCLPQGATEHYEYYEGNIAKDIAELKKKYAGEKEDE